MISSDEYKVTFRDFHDEYVEECFLDENAALEFAESRWISGLKVKVYLNDELWHEYQP